MSINKKLGELLRRLREQRRWSLSYVGEICDTSGANISKIELGQAKEYSLDLLLKLAGAYGLQLHNLFALVELGDVTATVLKAEEAQLFDAYRAMTTTQRETLMSVALTLRPPKKS